jgi:serine/threonine-protein kinase
MDAVTWERAKDLITDVLKRAPGEREAFLREQCPDPQLRAEIEAMLRAYDNDPDFLEQPPPVVEEVDEFADLQPGTRVGPYVIVDRLGRGGMGQVFLSSDPRLHRRVALKCLFSSTIGGDDRRRRILREARAAAAISHPNVATIYDVLEHDGRAFIVMEYVEGESLAARLKRERLSIAAVLSIGRQLVAAVAAAHATGVIHRDLKPGNVQLLPDGTVKVLDFGVAKAAAIASSSSVTTRRQAADEADRPYVLVGTPGYMSPEQMLGREVDDRSDVFTLGVVLYEMTTGRRPFTKNDFVDLVMTMAKRPPRVDAGDPRVPAALADVIDKALQIDPADRFQSAGEMERALAAVSTPVDDQRTGFWSTGRLISAFAAAAAVILALLLATPLRRAVSAPSTPQHRVVAVLPLENLSGDPSKQYLGAGMADTLTMALSKVRNVTVISRSEVQEAVRRAQEPRKIVEDLHASYLVDGSIQQVKDELLVTLRLVQPDGTVAWSEGYEDDVSAVFRIHRAMAADLVRQMQGSSASPDLTAPPTSNVDALTAYWQGRSLLDRAVSPPEFEEALGMFAKAAEIDPNFALAYAGQADAYWKYYALLHNDQTLPRKALDAGLKARRLDANQPAVRVSVATIYQGMGQYNEAIDELRKALELQPANDDVHRTLALVFNAQGKADEAIRELNEAIKIRPEHWINHYELGLVYYRIRHLAEAAAAFQRALELRPNDSRVVGNLGLVYYQAWDNDRALEYFNRANTLAPSSRGFTNVCSIYQRLGRFDDAVQACREAIRLNAQYDLAHYNLGDAYLRQNRVEDARGEFRIARELGLGALRINEKDARTMGRIAVCEAQLGMTTAADSHAASAVALAPQDPEVQYKRAVVDALTGRREEALQALRRALELGFSRSEAREDRDLAAIKQSEEFRALVGVSGEGGDK